MNNSLESIEIDLNIYNKIEYKKIKDSDVILLSEDSEKLLIASHKNLDNITFRYLESIFLKPIKTLIFTKKDIDLKFLEIDRNVNMLSIQNRVLSSMNNKSENEDKKLPIIELITLLISYAIESNSSDIHIESKEHKIVVRYRIDGVLHYIFTFNNEIYSALITRLKLLASLDISNIRKPQNASFSIEINKENIDCRVSIMPTIIGNSIVIRVLNNKKSLLNIDNLGLSINELRKLKKVLNYKHGMILVTGPTGSGKSTTLYAIIEYLNDSKKKIITIEDPVEYKIDDISQIEINEKIDFNFADALKNVLRQDPDILMIGEIRDVESLNIAVKASLTGHLLLSTLHTNSAISTITRLKDMGIKEYLIPHTLLGVISQRLVRKLCDFCKEPIQVSSIDKEFWKYFKDKNSTIFQATGCKYCSNMGYDGRITILEFMTLDNENIKNIIKNVDSENSDMYEKLQINPIINDAMKKVKDGITSIDEVLRVLH